MKDIRKIQDSDEFERYFVRKLKTVGLSKEQKKKILEILEDLTTLGINLTYRLFSGNCINFRDILDDEVLDDEET